MDTPVIFSALRFQFRIVARHDLFKLPFVGWHLQRSGQVPVNVTNPRRVFISSFSWRSREDAAGRYALVHFSRGRPLRDRSPGKLHERPRLYGNPGRMADRSHGSLIGTYELLPMHSLEFHPVPVTLAVGDPIETTGYGMKQIEDDGANKRRNLPPVLPSFLSPATEEART